MTRKQLRIVDQTSPYTLTVAVFSRDREAVRTTSQILRNASGIFHENDKADSKLNLVHWISAKRVKENPSPPLDY